MSSIAAASGNTVRDMYFELNDSCKCCLLTLKRFSEQTPVYVNPEGEVTRLNTRGSRAAVSIVETVAHLQTRIQDLCEQYNADKAWALSKVEELSGYNFDPRRLLTYDNLMRINSALIQVFTESTVVDRTSSAPPNTPTARPPSGSSLDSRMASRDPSLMSPEPVGPLDRVANSQRTTPV